VSLATSGQQSGAEGLRAEAPLPTTFAQNQSQIPLPNQPSGGTGAINAPAVDPRAAAHPSPHAAPLAAQLSGDEGLTVTVLPHSAHMAIESPDGDLALHLRVREGSAEITMGGSMAHLFQSRAPEARAALASEGLTLGRFDSGQSGGGQNGQPAPELRERSSETPAPYRSSQGTTLPTTQEGRIHVTA